MATFDAQGITLGYHKIRGLGAPCRMLLCFSGEPFYNKAYAGDLKEEWFAKDKPALVARNSYINLPYVIDGDTVVTQSNSVLLYLGRKLAIDKDADFFANHQALDQCMDLRNDLMKIVYPFSGVCKDKADFPAALERHLKGAAGHFGKLEQGVRGPFLCGAAPQSADFHLFEMVDQHLAMVDQTDGVDFDFAAFPKLAALHAAMKALPELATYFKSPMYTSWAFNNAMFTHFLGAGYGDGPYGTTSNELFDPKA